MLDKHFIICDNVIPDQEDLLPHPQKQVRCYKTGTTEVISICHHCGRFLSETSQVKPQFYQDHTLELTPMLRGREAQAVHCKTHAHYLPYSPIKVLVIPGIILASAGGIWLLNLLEQVQNLSLFARIMNAFQVFTLSKAIILTSLTISTMWGNALIPISLLVIGLLLIAIGLNQHRIFRAKALGRPLAAIPLLGEAYAVSIKENIEIEMKLSATGEDYIQKATGEGAISLQIYLTDDEIENVRELYWKKGKKHKFEEIDERIDEFELGWLAVTSSPYTSFDFGRQALYMKQHIPPENLESRAWYEAVHHTYQILPEAIYTRVDVPEKMKRTLLQIHPVLEEFRGGHTLRLEFDIVNNVNNDMRDWYYNHLDVDSTDNPILQALRQATVQHLSLKVNTDNTPFPGSSDLPIVESWGRVSRKRDKVEWRDISIANLLEQQQSTDYDALTHYPLRVTFSSPLTELKTRLEISFKILVEAAISGTDVKSSHLWLPNGQSLVSKDSNFVKRETSLYGSLTVDPTLFAFQRETTAPEVVERAAGIPLTSRIVNELVQRLEQEHQVYVKSVVKSTPVTESQAELAYQKRNWNILGRFYTENNHPIDVYILLVSRTPFSAEGETITWGNVTCRALQMSKGQDVSAEMMARCKELKTDIQTILQPKDIPPQWQMMGIPRILGQS